MIYMTIESHEYDRKPVKIKKFDKTGVIEFYVATSKKFAVRNDFTHELEYYTEDEFEIIKA